MTAAVRLHRRLPDGRVRGWSQPFPNRRHAAKAAIQCLKDNAPSGFNELTRDDWYPLFTELADELPEGTWSRTCLGYCFKIIKEDCV